MTLEVIHADAHLAAVDKPAGRLVVPGRGAPEATVAAEARERLGPIWVVHRLDRGTSGVVLLARTAEAHRRLCGVFERHEVVKRYLAIVRGSIEADLRIDVPIAPGRKGRMRAGAGLPGARPSSTFVRPLVRLGAEATLVEAFPASGRTHQVRLHLAHAGHPLVVDPDYGAPGPWSAPGGGGRLDRTPLHAASLDLLHPVEGTPLHLEAPVPEDMARAIEALRAGQASSKSG